MRYWMIILFLLTIISLSAQELKLSNDSFTQKYSHLLHAKLRNDITINELRLAPNVGHTFISISQGNNTKVLGFYPAKGVYPGIRPSSAPALVNDAGHAYNVKIEISVNSSQMASVLSVAKSYEQQNYHLSNYNCTDFGMSISSAAGVTLPDTRGSWPGGGGSNPGNLGQDIRNMSNSSSKYSVSTSKGNAPSNKNNCG